MTQHFWADTQIINLRHEGSTILIQCYLGICRGQFNYQKPPFKNLITGFLVIGEDVKFCEFFSMGHHTSHAWVVRSKMIGVVNLIIV